MHTHAKKLYNPLLQVKGVACVRWLSFTDKIWRCEKIQENREKFVPRKYFSHSDTVINIKIGVMCAGVAARARHH